MQYAVLAWDMLLLMLCNTRFWHGLCCFIRYVMLSVLDISEHTLPSTEHRVAHPISVLASRMLTWSFVTASLRTRELFRTW